MTIWESGRETELLDDIIAGRKTIEGRLNRDKFAKYVVGDTVLLRRDFRDENGDMQSGYPRAAKVVVTGIRHYKTFIDMVTTEGFKKVIPSAVTAQSAANEYNKYYSATDQAKFGVLAIEISVLK